MIKLTDEQIKRIVQERNTDEIKKQFHKHRNNGHEINKIWEEIAKTLDFNCKGIEIKNKYNDLLKQFRKKKIEASKSGAKAVTWSYYNLFLEVEAEGTEIVAPSCLDTAISAQEDPNSSWVSSSEIENKKRYVPAIDKVLTFMKDDADKKFKLFERIFIENDSSDLEKRIEKLEENSARILDALEKILKK